MKSSNVVCDLCHKQQPCIYCSSDSAFLCFDCDLHVHSANFLVARHIRVPLCNTEEEDDASSSSSTHDCVSSTDNGSCSATNTTSRKTTNSKVSSDWKTRDVLENWCTRLGMSSTTTTKVIIETAFRIWWVNRSKMWPYRVALAASVWLGLLRSTKNNNRMRMSILLKRLEEISGVPAKSIVIAQSRLVATSKMMKRTCEDDNAEESWAEC